MSQIKDMKRPLKVRKMEEGTTQDDVEKNLFVKSEFVFLTLNRRPKTHL